ncbi:MAG: ABC transporter substrate-binding protein [Candidatus Velthaea sp.]
MVVHGPHALARGAAALLLVLFAGCGGGSASNAGSGAQLVMARVKDAVVLDPAHATDGLSLNTTAEVMETLVGFKAGSFEIIPALATKWSASADGKTWTFTLRAGARFSDGTPADAAAVKFNVDRWRLVSNKAHGAFPYAYYADVFGGYPGAIVDVRAPAPATVVFRLAAPMGPFLRDLAMPSFAIGSPRAIEADPYAFERKPVGSGPYQLAEWVKDDHITLTVNPTYSGRLPKPVIPSVIIRDIPDQATSVLSMQKGDIQMLTDPRPDDAKALARETNVRIAEQPPNNVSYVALNMDKKPFDDLRVRQAVAYAIDAAAIVRGLYSAGTVVADNWTPPGMLGANPAVRGYRRDVRKARALLAAAGFPKGLTTTLYYPTSPRPYMPEPQRVAETLQAQLQEGGINATLAPFEFGVFLAKVRNGEHDMCLIGWTGDNGDPDNFFYPVLDQDSAHKGTAQNYSFWRDPAFHKLMLAGQHTVDEAQRKAAYMAANQMVHDQAPTVPLVHTAVPFALSTTIRGFVPSPDTRYHFELIKPAEAK